MNIANLCDREVVGIPASASIHDAAALMCEEHVGSLVVVNGEDPPKVVGMLTDRDLALDVLGRQALPDRSLSAGDLAKAPPMAVRSSASLQEAVTAMEQAGVRRLLVVDDDGGVVGVVAAEDVLAAISQELAGLVQALRKGIRREQGERKVISVGPAPRPIFPAFGTAMQ